MFQSMQTAKVMFFIESGSKVVCGLWTLIFLMNLALSVVLGHMNYSERSPLDSISLLSPFCSYSVTASLEWILVFQRRHSNKTSSSITNSHRRQRFDHYFMFQAVMASIAAFVVLALFCVTLVKRQVDADLLLVNRLF
jgi:hypothetical protein